MADEDGYQSKVFNWIESIISCGLPSMTEIFEEHNSPLPRSPLPRGAQDVQMKDQPCAATLLENKFTIEFHAFGDNNVVLFLMQCNMDIKYIGSGEAAKSLI